MPSLEVGRPNNPQALLLLGAVAHVHIGFDASWTPRAKGNPDVDSTTFPALIDTGATHSCIDSVVATTLNLPVVDAEKISGVGGVMRANIYLAQVHCPGLNWLFHGRFIGVHLLAGSQPYAALLGRDFLMDFTAKYDGPTGSVVLSRP